MPSLRDSEVTSRTNTCAQTGTLKITKISSDKDQSVLQTPQIFSQISRRYHRRPTDAPLVSPEWSEQFNHQTF